MFDNWLAPEMIAPLLIGTAFLFGLGAHAVRLPPMVGFLIAGITLRGLGVQSSDLLKQIADLGVTILMFSLSFAKVPIPRSWLR